MFVVCCFMCVFADSVKCVLFVVCRLLYVVCWSLIVACCLACVVCCCVGWCCLLLFVGSSLVFDVCCDW